MIAINQSMALNIEQSNMRTLSHRLEILLMVSVKHMQFYDHMFLHENTRHVTLTWLWDLHRCSVPPEVAEIWILTLIMSIGWMQHVAKEPEREPVKNGLAAVHAPLSDMRGAWLPFGLRMRTEVEDDYAR